MAHDPCSKRLDHSRGDLRAGSWKSKTLARHAAAGGEAAPGALSPLTVFAAWEGAAIMACCSCCCTPCRNGTHVGTHQHNSIRSGSAEDATAGARSAVSSAGAKACKHNVTGCRDPTSAQFASRCRAEMSGDCAWLAGSAAGPGEAEPCSWGTAPCTPAGRSRRSGLGRGRLSSCRNLRPVGSGLPCSSTQAVLLTRDHTTQHPACLPDLGAPNSTCEGAVPDQRHLRCACSSHRCHHRRGAAV